jgi:hypothetical protein
MPLQAFEPGGNPIASQVGVTPLLIRLEPTLFKIVGTGFYVARYGLLLTAKHVVEEVAEHDAEGRPTVAWIWKADGTLNFRPLITCSFDNRAPRDAADIAICQAVDNAKPGSIRVAQVNERIALVTRLPDPGTAIATYSYPDNHRVDFSSPERVGRIFADGFEGRVLEIVGPQDRFLRYTHVETSIQIRGGASGGPVFGSDGHAFAVNCRGWDLGADQGAEPLSSVVPVSLILDLEFQYPVMPAESWEARSVPENRRDGKVTLRDLAAWGHIVLDPRPIDAAQVAQT